MVKERVGEIRVSKRIVRIGHEVYPLANISRVQTLELVHGGKAATFYPLRRIVVVAVWVGVIVATAVIAPPLVPNSSDYEIEETARQFALIAVALGAVIAGCYLLMLLYRLFRKPRYALVIETAGTQYTALNGTDRAEIRRIEGYIVSAIEDPPDHELPPLIIHGDVAIGGDNIKNNSVSGSGNRLGGDRRSYN